MLKLGLNSFFNNSAKMPYTFKVNFFTFDLNNNLIKEKSLSDFNVISVQLPKVEISKENSLFLGNTRLIYPVYNWSTRKLNITFEETDNFDVIKELSSLQSINNSYINPHPDHVIIQLSEYDNNFLNENSHYYVCSLISFDEPKFTRTGNPQSIQINASFNVFSEIDSIEFNSYKTSNTVKVNDFVETKINKNETKLIPIIPSLADFTIINEAKQLVPPVAISGYSRKDYANKAAEYYSNKPKTLVDENLNELSQKILSGRDDNNTLKSKSSTNENNFEKLISQAKNSGNEQSFLQNTFNLQSALSDVSKELKQENITFSINCYAGTDGSHADGENATHGIGAKADLTFHRSNGEKITPENATIAEMNQINDILAKHGLVMQYETTGQNGSGWGDVALQKFYNKNGELVDDRSFKNGGSNLVYNSSNGKYEPLEK